uniref:Uncharacterized protein n=1 Tax=Rhabditophanes sp. KR3021 TaxID=114890 RepID=A0AC35U657_9BILA
MFKLFVILSVASFVASQGEIPNQCNQIQFKACSANLAQAINLSPELIFSNSTIFRMQMASNFYEGRAQVYNWVNQCNALSQFYGCLGQINVNECLNPVGLIIMGLSPDMAFDYDGSFKQYAFECGVGFNQRPEVYQCLGSTWMNAASQLTALSLSYRLNVQHDPTNACKYALALQNGYAAAFGNNNCRALYQKWATWWGCSIMNEYVTGQFRHCTNKCTYDQILTMGGNFIKFDEDGKMLMLIPKTWHKDPITGELYQEEEMWL